jgi:riboflavin synthase alpha subunit
MQKLFILESKDTQRTYVVAEQAKDIVDALEGRVPEGHPTILSDCSDPNRRSEVVSVVEVTFDALPPEERKYCEEKGLCPVAK